ncbi:MAG: uncharacterized protein JWP01_3326 [Myxococcales bacterium]|nr:uncharacterized protein [Myxococcales bacterium]
MLKTSLIATLCATSLVACVKQDEAPEDLKRAIPQAEQVSIKLPGGAERTVGQLAEWYVATRHVTRTFNGGAGWVLVLIHTIIQFPVTTINGDTYTWGPWSDALDPAEYKLDVRALADGTYEYQLSGRSKTQSGASFEVIVDGVADPRPGDLKGNGSFLLDFDAGKRVNPIDSDPEARGQVDVHYDLAARHLDLGIISTNENNEPVMANYAYNETLDGGGDMVFNVDGNAGGTMAQEQITLRSRWQSNGMGRADARLTGGDLTSSAIASECWDGGFKRTYYSDNVSFAPAEGDVADCAFAAADLPPAN